MKRCKHCGTELTSGYVICSDRVDEVERLKQQAEQLKAEKRALINDLKQAANLPCRYCKHNQNQSYCAEYCQYHYQDGKRTFPHFEWRGAREAAGCGNCEGIFAISAINQYYCATCGKRLPIREEQTK